MFPPGLRIRAYHARPPVVRRSVVKPNKIFNHVLDADPNTVFIRMGANKDFLRSPADALALIRDVERRFGPIQDFRLKRDYEQNTRYQSFVHAAFKDPASYQLLPSVATTFAFKRPSVDSKQPGGIGLEDLKPFLQTQTSEQPSSSDASPQVSESEDSAPDENTISYTVKRCDSNFTLPSMFTKAVDVSSRTGRLFLEWGGFHSLKPISSETELGIEKVFRPTSIDHFRMRCAVRRYSEMIHLPNPYEIDQGQALETALQEQNPLQIPNPESVSQDSTMPSDVLVESQTPDISVSSDAPTLHTPPSSTASTTSTSTQHESDTTSPSPALESPSPSAQPEASVQEPVATSPSPVPPPSRTPPQPSETSKTLPESVAEAEAIATKMHQQAKTMNRAKQKKEQKRKEKEANPLPDLSKKKKPAQPSMRNATKGFMNARQAADAKQTTVEKPKTIKEKISGFFSGLF